MSSVDGRNARPLFKLPLFTMELSIQEGDRYIVVVAEGMENKEIGEGKSELMRIFWIFRAHGRVEKI